MHHVVDDKRTQRSANMIYDGLMTALDARPFSQVTVSEVCRQAHVSRATFYRLFNNVSDVLAWRCNQLADELFRELSRADSTDLHDSLIALERSWMSQWKLVSAMASAGRLDLLLDAHLAHVDALCELFAPDAALSADQRETFATVLTALLAACFKVWESRGRAVSAEDLHGEMIGCFAMMARLME